LVQLRYIRFLLLVFIPDELLDLSVSLSFSLPLPVLSPEDICPQPFMKIIQDKFGNIIQGCDQGYCTEYILKSSLGCLCKNSETDDECCPGRNKPPADRLKNASCLGIFILLFQTGMSGRELLIIFVLPKFSI